MLKPILIAMGALLVFWLVVVPLFERVAPRNVVRAYQRLSKPLFIGSAGFVPGFGVIETIGRRTGRPRRTPVGGHRRGGSFWLVAGIGRGTFYVRNMEANPRVRVKHLGRWRTGTAHLLPDDDAGRRMFRVSKINGFFLWLAGGDHLTVRIDFDA